MRRSTMMILTMTMLAAPMAAQDTSITIQKSNSDTECSVRINGRQLSDAEAKPICAKAEGKAMMLRIQSDSLRVEAIELGDRARVFGLRNDSLARIMKDKMQVFEERTRDLAERKEFFGTVMSEAAKARPLIGVSVDPAPRETDRYGAYIVAVTPGGPADKAGLRSGDIITKVAGKEIGTTQRPKGDEQQSLVSIKLIEVVGGLEAGKAARIDYRRENKNLNVMVTPMEDRTMLMVRRVDELPAERFSTIIERMADRFPAEPAAPGSPRGMVEFRSSPMATGTFTWNDGGLSRIEMAPVNAKLGAYFGVTSGVLVVNVPAEGNMNLQPGDVVTAVDGRRIETPNEFLRVLRTYDAERSFKLQVTRQKRQEVITTTLP